jgi:branched-chain amino acid transport system ATP-binding protein
MVAIARALMSMPETLLLDEPSLGLAPMVVDETFEIMGKINELGISILLVEQNAVRALELATYCYVLEGHRDQTLQTRQSPHSRSQGY